MLTSILVTILLTVIYDGIAPCPAPPPPIPVRQEDGMYRREPTTIVTAITCWTRETWVEV